MKRVLAILVVAAAMAVGLSAGTAGARVHGISQAGCANDPSRSGANLAQGATPAAPIPIGASPTFSVSNGTTDFPAHFADLNADCNVPLGPPSD